MHIDKLTLENYRGASHLPLELDKHLNVFVGMNGAGKSSILDASATLLSWLVNRIKHINSSGRHIPEVDIRNGESSANLDIRFSDETTYYFWNLSKTRKGYSKNNMNSSLNGMTKKAKKIQSEITETNGQLNIPLFVYYPVNRAVLDIPLRIKSKHSFDLLSAYDDSLTSGASFRTFFEWFREREDLENENRKYKDQLIKANDFQFPDLQLETVRKAISEFLPEFTNLTVRRNPLRMEVEKNKELLSVNQLSDGEKCLMALVGDLARRLAIANPLNSNPLKGEGIILIDEIDLHLHPKWQRMVVPKLIEVFPNCQFLVTTHSPHVINHVHDENLFLLTQNESGIVAEHPSESYGKNVDRVLEDIMGLETTRPDQVNDDLHLLYTEINQGKLSKARQTIKEMKSEIGADPELVKAEVLIKRKEIIGK